MYSHLRRVVLCGLWCSYRPLVRTRVLKNILVIFQELDQPLWTSGTVCVFFRLRSVWSFKVLQERGEKFPANVKLIISDKVGVVARQDVLD